MSRLSSWGLDVICYPRYIISPLFTMWSESIYIPQPTNIISSQLIVIMLDMTVYTHQRRVASGLRRRWPSTCIVRFEEGSCSLVSGKCDACVTAAWHFMRRTVRTLNKCLHFDISFIVNSQCTQHCRSTIWYILNQILNHQPTPHPKHPHQLNIC